MKEKMTRQEFFQTLAMIGVAVVGGGSVMASCSKKEEAAQTETASKPAPETAMKAADPCGDVSALTDNELKMRNDTLKYVATTPEAGKQCDNCKFWTPPADGAACGGCTLIKGPINAKGYCTSWFVADA